METSSSSLPSAPLSASLNRFLAQKFGTKEDLLKSSYIELELSNGCADLEAVLSDLDRRLSETIAVFFSRSGEVEARLRGIKEGLIDLKSSITNPVHEENEGILAEELPALAKEVARIKTIRAYAASSVICNTSRCLLDVSLEPSSIIDKLFKHNPGPKLVLNLSSNVV